MTFAQFVGDGSTGIIGIFNTVVIPFLFSLIFLVFVWGVVSYFFIHGGEEAKRGEGRKFMLWGVIGIAVLFSVWGFVNLILATLGLAPGA